MKSKEDEFTQLQSQLDMKEKDLQLLKHQLAESVKQKSVSWIPSQSYPFF